jgi:hypothetical protein
MATESETAIAFEILKQLGGQSFITMTGATGFLVTSEGALAFRLPSSFAKDGINAVNIKLDPRDTYTIRFYAILETNVKEVAVVSDVYNDELQCAFTEYTGLDTHL